jgi:hypothetical protein
LRGDPVRRRDESHQGKEGDAQSMESSFGLVVALEIVVGVIDLPLVAVRRP